MAEGGNGCWLRVQDVRILPALEAWYGRARIISYGLV